MIIENESYVLEVKNDGIFLYKKIESKNDKLSDSMSKLKIDKNKQSQSSAKDKVLLLKTTLFGSSYELIFAIVDAIVNRCLQRNFSFETDQHANHLRIMFGLLVNELNVKLGFAYDKHHFTKKTTSELTTDGFMAIKRVLDVDNSKKSDKDKQSYLNIAHLQDLDIALANALENYHSDDSDSEGEHSDKEEDTSPPSPFVYSNAKNPKEQQKSIEAARLKFNKFLSNRVPKRDKLEVVNGKVKIDDEFLAVDFVIPGFRGINHMPLRFSDNTRRLYRSQSLQKRRTVLPYYSEAIMMSRFDFYRDEEGIKQHLLTANVDNQNRKELDNNAAQLEQKLVEMRDGDYIVVTGLSNGALKDIRLFSNFLYFLQHLYSNGIIKSQRLLREHQAQEEVFLPLPNAYNPFVSESEAPEHALRYSFGQKELYQPAALHPHYDRHGKPSFPYIGEIYISIRGMDVVTSKSERHQLRRLESLYRVNVDRYIGPEIESTGFGWLPAGAVVFSEVVKCPSFKGHWKRKFRTKYGLTKAQFKSYKQRITASPNKSSRLQVEAEVINHLIQFYSSRLLQCAFDYAKDHKKVLVFLNSQGNLDFDLPERNMEVNANDNAKKARELLEGRLRSELNESNLEVKLTSKTMKIYRVSPTIVDDMIKKVIRDKPELKSDYDKFRLDDERLRTPPSAHSSPRTPLSSPSKSQSPYRYTGSPGTPLGSSSYKKIAYNLEDAEKKEPLTLEQLQKLHHEYLVEQQQLRASLKLTLTDYEILTLLDKVPNSEAYHEQKQQLYDITLKLFQYNQQMLPFNYEDRPKHEVKAVGGEDWYVNVNNRKIFFTETPVLGNGWCTLNAIGIADPQKAIKQLITNIKQKTITNITKGYLLQAIWNNYHARVFEEPFLTTQIDSENQNILNKIQHLQGKINAASLYTVENKTAHNNLITYLSRNDVLTAYLNYIIDSKYADENIAAALLDLSGKKFVALHNYKNNGELYCGSDQLNINDPSTVFVIYHPSSKPDLAHYNTLTYNHAKTQAMGTKPSSSGAGKPPTIAEILNTTANTSSPLNLKPPAPIVSKNALPKFQQSEKPLQP